MLLWSSGPSKRYAFFCALTFRVKRPRPKGGNFRLGTPLQFVKDDTYEQSPQPGLRTKPRYYPGNTDPTLNISTIQSLTTLIFGALRDSG